MIARVRFFAALLMATVGFHTGAGEGPTFEAYTTDDGLSNNTVTAVLQDSRGFIWVGTEDGLNLFDGYHFQQFKYAGDGNGLNSNRVLSLAEDGEGGLWIGTNGGGLNRYDLNTGAFTHFMAGNVPGSLADNRVRAVLYDRYGDLWVGTDGGLNRYNPRDDSFILYERDPRNPASIGHNRVLSLFEDSHGLLWVGTSSGLNQYDPKSDGFRVFRRRGRDPDALQNNVINHISEDSYGILWVATDGGLHHYDYNRFQVYRHDPEKPGSLSSNVVLNVLNDNQGEMWVGTDKGLNLFDWLREDFAPIATAGGDRNTVSVLYEDRGGILWVGTRENGLHKIRRGSKSFDLFRPDPERPETLIQAEVNALFEDRLGRLWVGTNGGLDMKESDSGDFIHFNRGAEPDGLSGNRIQAITQDWRGVMWVGTNGSGLNRLDPNGRITHYRNSERRDSLSSDQVWALLEDKRTRFWVGTQNGLNQMNRAEGTFDRIRHDPDDPTTIGSSAVGVLYEDRGGRIWLGTEGGGLSRMEEGEGGFFHYRNNPEDPQSLSHNHVNSIYQDRQGMLWIGTWGGGINRMDPEVGTFEHWREADGLPNDVIFGILGDGRDHLWLSTNNGIVRFEPEIGRFHAYDENDGLQGQVFRVGAFARGRDGTLYFGGDGGFNRFRPEDLRMHNTPPVIAVTAFRSFNQLIGSHLVEDRTYTLEHTDNYLTFEFAALDYADTDKNIFSFKMEGVDQDWQTTAERDRNYPKLAPGKYRFRVRGADSKGAWNEEGIAITVEIRPPWWQTKVIYTLEVLLGLGLLVGLFMGQRKRLKKQEAEALLALELQTKTQELEEARNLQLSMLPRSLPGCSNVQVAVYMQTAAEVGGDYYDFYEGEDGSLTIAIGDATGHGLMAGTFVAATKSLFLSLAQEPDLVEVMARASLALRGMGLRKMFMALALARLKGNTLTMVGGGMPPVLVYRAATHRVDEVVMRGLPLGTPPFPYRAVDIDLESGDMVLFQSDGLEEMFDNNSQMLGSDRIHDLFEQIAADHTPQQAIDVLAGLGRDWSRNRAPDDDVTLLILRYAPAVDKEPLS
ncbi:MAG: two-component regulator propeller domain-containing protein [Acidobacteriota bacterium]|nr:two-component regulator propeller domain-containing protein [Acidobacteriota bacterium]